MSLLGLYKKYREVISYLFWGVCTTAVNIVSYWLCFSIFNIPNIPSTIISWVIAVAFAYVTNRRFVFRSKSQKIFEEVSKFVGARLLTGFLDVAIMFFAVDVMNWMPIFWKIISNILVIVLNFILSKWFIFTDPSKKMVRKRSLNTGSIFIWSLIFIDIVGLILGLNWAKTTITYLEHTPNAPSFSTESSVVLSEGEQISQDVSMPYNIFNSIAIAIDDFDRTNNSTYNIQIQDSNNRILLDKDFSPAKLPEDKILRITGNKNLAVNTDEKYRLVITPKDVVEGTEIGLRYRDGSTAEIFYDIYGGEYRFWWTGFTLFISIYVAILLIRALYLVRHGKKVFKDRMFRALLLFGVILALASVFSVGGYFTDEYDNMQGGIAIAHGSVLYKDYVTQHTPFTYYLCAFFHALGAESITQFRLMFYVLYALVWAFMYYRYSKIFKGARIVTLSIAITCVLSCAYATNLQLLYDIVQMMCFIVLMFEFISYCKERQPGLGWVRSVVIALCIYTSVGAAFNSVFTLVAFGVGFLVTEIKYWKNSRISFSSFLKRYYRLILAMIIPAVGIVAYFWASSALKNAYEQAYLFNTQVYSNYYMDGYGSNMIEPFVLGINNFLVAIGNSALNLAKSKFSPSAVFFVITILVSIYTIFKQCREKHYVIGLVTLMVICFSFSRENFHTISAWAVMLFSCIILFPTIQKRIAEWQWFIIAPVVLFLFVPYYEHVKTFVLFQQEPVSAIDAKIISNTEKDDYVGMDSYLHDSLYLQYKQRRVANRNMYILPWYMVWYEESVMDDYETHQPKVVVYDPDTELWGIKDYAPRLKDYIKQNYIADKNLPTLWIRKSL